MWCLKGTQTQKVVHIYEVKSECEIRMLAWRHDMNKVNVSEGSLTLMTCIVVTAAWSSMIFCAQLLLSMGNSCLPPFRYDIHNSVNHELNKS